MPADDYDELASVYDWIVPDELLTPEGSAAAFLPYLDGLASGARVLDCACGTGPLAVGLAQQGFDVTATDASGGMVARTRALAADAGVGLLARESRWEDLPAQGFAPFDAVLCVGNSLAHAEGRAARRAALRAMAGVLDPPGVLVLTSRNFEGMRAAGTGLQVFDRVVERHGRRGVVIYSWWLAEDWEDEHGFDVAVALLGEDGAVTTRGERLRFWPYSHDMLRDDLRAAGFEPETSTFAPGVDRYLLTARRRG
jgi:2-polyprenyl-3-methyl-5-hydroxy-6-metoxy-1,4-benzoquinol methylase